MGGFDDILRTDSPGFGDLFSLAGDEEDEGYLSPEERWRRHLENLRRSGGLDQSEVDSFSDESYSLFERASDYQRASRRSFGASWKRNLWDITQAPSSILELSAKAKRAILPKSLEGVATRNEELALRAIDALTPESVKRKRDEAAQSAEEAKVAKAEAGLRLGLPDAVQVAQNFGEDFTTMALDPLELLPGGIAAEGVSRSARAITRGRRVVGAASRFLPEGIEELAAASQKIGASGRATRRAAEVVEEPAEGVVRKLTSLDEAGNPIGSMTFTVEPGGGFRVQDVETGQRGTGGMRAMYQKARDISGGPRLGSAAQTDEGAAALARLRETDPELVAPLPAQEVRRGLASEARRDPVRDRFLAKYTGAVPEPEKPKGVEWLRSVGRRIYVEGFNKDAPIEEILALDRNPELVRLVDRERGAAEIARGPLFRGTSTLDLETGQLERTGESLRDILEGLDGEAVKDLDSLLIADRQFELSDRLASIRASMEGLDPALLRGKDASPGLLRPRRASTRRLRPGPQLGVELTYKRTLPGNSRLLRATEWDPLLATPQGRVDVAAALREVDPVATADAGALVGHLQAKRGENFGDLVQRAQRIREWSRKAILDPLREVGLLSEEDYSRILDANQFYAPYVRVADRAALKLQESGAGFAREITKGLSEDAKITSPLEELVVKSQRVQRWVEKQRVRNAIADVAEANADALGEVVRPATEQEVRGRKSFAVWRNGEVRHWTAPDDVIRALDRSNVGDASLLMKAITFPARTLRAGATLTAEFMARNPIRDQFTAAVYSRHGYIPFYDFAKGLFHMSPAGRRLSGIYDEFLDSGTAIASMAQVDRPHVISTLRDLTGTGAIGKVNSFLRAWRREGALYPLQEISGIGEKGTRVGAYARARSRGVSVLDAMNEARDITLDFGRAGYSGRIANGMYAFLNAELQDLDKVRRAFKARPVATSAKALAYIAIPSLANWAMWKDDPDYQNLQSWEKATYYHLKKREDGTFIRMPRPIGVLPLLAGYGLHQFLDFAMERDPQAVEEFVGRIATDTPARFVARPQNLLPTALEPIAEVTAGPGGWDFWRDTPIVPRGLQDVAPQEQFNDRTPAIVRDAAGAVGASPLKAQHLIKATTGGLGDNVVSIVDAIYREALGEKGQKIPGLPTTAKDVPLAKGFVSGSPFGFGSRTVNRLYDLADKAQQAELTFKRMRGRGAAASDLLSFRGDHPEILQAKRLREARKKLSDLRDKREKIRTLAHVTPEQRADMLLKIDQAITEYAHRLLVGMGYEVEVGP